MRAAYYERKGNPQDVLQLGQIPEPVPGPGDVRVQIKISAINPSDTKQRQGWNNQVVMPYPRIVPHNDGSGVIVEAGPGVPPGRIGERVWVFEAQREGRAFGTAAEYVVVPSRNAVHLPDAASFEDGASMGVPGMTAHHLLFADGPIHGKTILIQGGAGSVGHVAVQLARWAGAKVIATVGSDEQADVAKASGADYVFNYKADDVVAEIRRFMGEASPIDRVCEVAFVKNLDIDAAIIRPSGVIATFMVDEDPSRPPAVNLQQLTAKNATVHFVLVYAMSRNAHDLAAADLNTAMHAGALRPRVAGKFPLEQIADAHALLGTMGAGGKILLEVA